MATINHKVQFLNQDGTGYDTYHVETNVTQVYDFTKSKWLNEIIADLETELSNVTGGIDVTELNNNLNLTMQDLESVEGLISAIQTELAKKYVKPETGITIEDLNESIKASLQKVDTIEGIKTDLESALNSLEQKINGINADSIKTSLMALNDIPVAGRYASNDANAVEFINTKTREDKGYKYYAIVKLTNANGAQSKDILLLSYTPMNFTIDSRVVTNSGGKMTSFAVPGTSTSAPVIKESDTGTLDLYYAPFLAITYKSTYAEGEIYRSKSVNEALTDHENRFTKNELDIVNIQTEIDNIDFNPSIKLDMEEFIATAEQTIFTLANVNNLDTDVIKVEVGGVEQFSPDNFTKTTGENRVTTITFTQSLPEGIEVVVSYYGGIDAVDLMLDTHINNTNIHITDEERSKLLASYEILHNEGRLAPHSTLITDWNNALENGVYVGSGASTLNSPTLTDEWHIGLVMVADENWVIQKLIQYTDDRRLEFVRSKINGVWTRWKDETYDKPMQSLGDFRAERAFGAFTFESNTVSEYLRILIPKTITFWGMLEVNLTSIYQFTPVEGGAKIFNHIGFDSGFSYGIKREIISISDGFSENFHIGYFEELENHFSLEIVKREYKNPLSVTVTAHGGVGGNTPKELIESITIETGMYDSLLELPMQGSQYQDLIDEMNMDIYSLQSDVSELQKRTDIPDASSTVAGKVMLSSSTTDTSINKAATPIAVKMVNDKLKADWIADQTTNPPFVQGYTGAVRYRKLLGTVEATMDLNVTGTTLTANVEYTMFTLPTGFRPPDLCVGHIALINGSTTTFIPIKITPLGTVLFKHTATVAVGTIVRGQFTFATGETIN